MKKILFITIFLLFSLTTYSNSYECNFDKLIPGTTKKKLEEANIFAYGPEEEGIFIKRVSPYDLCLNDLSKVHGLIITLFFSKDTLVKVNYENTLPDNDILFDVINNVYSLDIKRNKDQVSKKQSEFYTRSLNNNSFFYAILKANNNQREYLEIVDDKKIEEFEKYILKVEETRR